MERPMSYAELREAAIYSLRSMPKGEKERNARNLIAEIVKWTSQSSFEALGILESTKLQFLLKAEEPEEEKEKRIVRRLT